MDGSTNDVRQEEQKKGLPISLTTTNRQA